MGRPWETEAPKGPQAPPCGFHHAAPHPPYLGSPESETTGAVPAGCTSLPCPPSSTPPLS
eukprot:30598-Eustigmatos_ZCMA.PRE.1